MARGALRNGVEAASLRRGRSAESVAPNAQPRLAKTCGDRSYGARPLRRALQKHVEDRLSEALIQGLLSEATLLEVFLDGNELNYRPAGLEEESDDALLIH